MPDFDQSGTREGRLAEVRRIAARQVAPGQPRVVVDRAQDHKWRRASGAQSSARLESVDAGQDDVDDDQIGVDDGCQGYAFFSR